jgi:hypothetical protein
VLLERDQRRPDRDGRTKFFVPSMGSMIHRVSVFPELPNSSPRNPCSGNVRRGSRRWSARPPGRPASPASRPASDDLEAAVMSTSRRRAGRPGGIDGGCQRGVAHRAGSSPGRARRARPAPARTPRARRPRPAYRRR